MILNNYISKKIILSCLISLGLIMSIFMIINLLGNLGENHGFLIILYLSLISSVQIFFYIPLFILFIILSVFSIILKTHNEFLIIRHYLSIKKISPILIIIGLVALILETNKSYIIDNIEAYKSNILDTNKIFKNQIYIDYKNNDNRDYFLVINSDNEEKTIVKYSILNNFFNEAIYANEFNFSNNKLFTQNHYSLFNEKILFNTNKILLLNNFNDFNNKKINYLNKKKRVEFKNFLSKIYLFLFIILLIILFFDKQILNKNKKIFNQYFYTILLLFYSYLVISINLNLYLVIFQILSLVLLVLIISQKIFYEKSL